MIIEDNLKIAKLIDVYGKLLTDKQYQIMTSYYFDETERLVANPHKGVGTRAQELYDTYCEKYAVPEKPPGIHPAADRNSFAHCRW